MGLIDDIAEKASDKIVQAHAPAPKQETAGNEEGAGTRPNPKDNQGVVSPSGMRGQIVEGTRQTIPGNPQEVAATANPQIADVMTPAGSILPQQYVPKDMEKPTGGGTPSQPPGAPGPVTEKTKSVGPVVGQNAGTQLQTPTTPGAYDTSAVGGKDYRPNTSPALTNPNQQPDPIADAAKQPGFWDNVKKYAEGAGKTFLEILGDIGANARGMDNPTHQRLQREHEERMQGNQLQAQKDYLSLQQGFEGRYRDIDNQYRTQEFQLQNLINSEQDVNKKQELSNQLLQIKGQHQTELMNAQAHQREAENAYFVTNLNWRSKAANEGNFDAWANQFSSGSPGKQ